MPAGLTKEIGWLRRVPRPPRSRPRLPRARRSQQRRPRPQSQCGVHETGHAQRHPGGDRRFDQPIPRTEVTKRLWAYIKKNGLQDQKNRRMIKADDKLKAVFGGKPQANMFEMTKLVGKHLK